MIIHVNTFISDIYTWLITPIFSQNYSTHEDLVTRAQIYDALMIHYLYSTPFVVL